MRFNLPKKIIYPLTIIVMFFIVLELFLRLVGFSGRADDTRFVLNPEWDYPEFFEKDHDLFWKFRPHQVIKSDFFVEGEYHINNHRLRGPDFSAKKDPGTFRIICLGNSCTFGWGVSEDQVYSRQLEKILADTLAGRKYEVINAGVTGYTSLQGLRFLRQEVLEWDPDLLVVSFGWNDHWAGAQDIADKDQHMPSQWILDIQNLLGRTRVYRWLKYLVFSIKQPLPADFSRTQPVYRVNLTDFEKNMTQIVNEAANHGIKVSLLTAPIAGNPRPEQVSLYKYHGKYNDVIQRVGNGLGVGILDVADEFTPHSTVFDHPDRDIKHYNVNGHKMIAEMIADYIISQNEGN